VRQVSHNRKNQGADRREITNQLRKENGGGHATSLEKKENNDQKSQKTKNEQVLKEARDHHKAENDGAFWKKGEKKER